MAVYCDAPLHGGAQMMRTRTNDGDTINHDKALPPACAPTHTCMHAWMEKVTSCYLRRITEIGKLTTKNNDEINRLVMDEEGGSGFR